MKTKATVTLEHKTGPVKIDIEAATPEVAAYIANRIKEIFGVIKGGQNKTMADLFKGFRL